jgi:RNA polymerase sigma-70 factor (ECF subfamily)
MDKAAFDALYRQHYRQVLGLCRRLLGGDSDAEDAAQEVFMRGYRAFGSYKARDPFAPWIGTIASNYCIDVLRKRRRLADVFSDAAVEAEELVDPKENGEGVLIGAYEHATINRAVEALPEKYRLPIVLAYYADVSYSEIADTLGISTSHVGVLLLRGKERLRRELASPSDEPDDRREPAQNHESN